MLQGGGQSWGHAGVGTRGAPMVCVGVRGARQEWGSLGLLARLDLLVALGWCVAHSGLLSSWVRQEHHSSTFQDSGKDAVLL